MKKGICLDCVPGVDPKERFSNAAKSGFDGVEIATLKDDSSRRIIKELSERFCLSVPSIMNTDHWKYPLSDPDPAIREESIHCIAQSIDTAVYLGADTVLIVPGVVNQDVSYEQAFEISKKSISEILPYAEKHKIYLGIENVWNRFLLSPMEFADYVDSFNCEFIKAYFDVGNIVAYGYPEQWIRSLGSRIIKIHVKGFHKDNHQFTGLLEGTIEWHRVMRALKDIGYNGYITAELGVGDGDPMDGLNKISMDMDEIIADF
jgi:L-ribulose-5-phosphate 3-epimerase